MKRFVFVGILCLVIGALIGYYVGNRRKAAPSAPEIPVTPAAPVTRAIQDTQEMRTLAETETCSGIMKLYSIDEMRQAARSSNLSGNTAYAIDVLWLQASVGKLASEKQNCVHFIVQELIDKEWKVMDPARYRIFIEGYDTQGQYGTLEDFPPAVWPQE